MRLSRAAAALAAATAVTAPAAAAESSGFQPAYWDGNYGASPFHGRQVVTGDPDNFCNPPADPLDPVFDLLGHSPWCVGVDLQPARHAGGEFVTELAVCLADKGRGDSMEQGGGSYENTFQIYDLDDSSRIVRTWTEAEVGYQPSTFVFAEGDCVNYLWHIPMVTDTGAPLTSGHRHRIVYNGTQYGEATSPDFVAP